MQSVLNAHGPDAAIIAEISWVLFAGGSVVFAAVMAIAAYAAFVSKWGRTPFFSFALLVRPLPK